MGVQEPVEEELAEVPATPPGVQDINDDDDLFAQTEKHKNPPFTNEFFKGILPVLPYKGSFDFLGVQDGKDLPSLYSPAIEKCCPSCTEDVKKGLKQLEKFVQECKKETDYLKAENENLKKELEELKKQWNQNSNDKKDEETVTISNENGDNSGVSLGKYVKPKQNELAKPTESFSVGLPVDISWSPSKNEIQKEIKTESRKSVTQLRKEFFEKKFESEQKVFSSRHYLKIKSDLKKDNFRSRLTLRVEPKPRIAETISKLTLLSKSSRLIPDVAPVAMFQHFEKTRNVWINDFTIEKNGYRNF